MNTTQSVYHHKSSRSFACAECGGSGRRMVTQRRWVGGTRNGYWSTHTDWARCSDCEDGLVYVSEFAEEGGEVNDNNVHIDPPITFGGQEVTAPGFTQAQFERAMVRALIDELEVHQDRAGGFIVCHKNRNGGYMTSRSSCTCKAGEHGTPCKHRAAVIFHLDIRQPAIRKAWQETNRIVAERRAKSAGTSKAVA